MFYLLFVQLVMSCTIKRDFQYNRVMPTFHHWKTGNLKYGLTFQTAADARAFDKAVKIAVDDLLSGEYCCTGLTLMGFLNSISNPNYLAAALLGKYRTHRSLSS